VQRILDVKSDQKRQGKHLGGKRPFGYQIGEDGKLIEDAREQAAIRRIVEMRKADAPLRSIQEALAEDGHSLSHVAVSRILKREGVR
jgi:hypothetical protein